MLSSEKFGTMHTSHQMGKFNALISNSWCRYSYLQFATHHPKSGCLLNHNLGDVPKTIESIINHSTHWRLQMFSFATKYCQLIFEHNFKIMFSLAVDPMCQKQFYI